MSGRIWGRSVFRTSYERYVSGEAEESRMRDSARLELEMRRGRETLKLSYRRRLRRSERGIPYPASGTSMADGHQEGQLLLTIRRGAVNRIRLSSRFKAGEGESGYLVAASVRFGFLRRRVRFTAASCLYRALSGEPVQYVYEPVLEGSYPWVRVKGNGSRGTVIVEVRWRDLAVSFRAVTGAAPIGTEFGLMAAYRR